MEQYLSVGTEDARLSLEFDGDKIIVTVKGRYKTFTDKLNRSDPALTFIGCVFRLEYIMNIYIEECAEEFTETRQDRSLDCLIDACNIVQAITKLSDLVKTSLAEGYLDMRGEEYSANDFITECL